MPNWCVNQIQITGDDATLTKLAEFVKEQDGEYAGEFSFNRIKPAPTGDEIYHGRPSQHAFVCGCQPTFDESMKDEATPNGKWVVNGKPVVKSHDLVEGSFASENGFGVERCPEHAAISVREHPVFFWNWNIANWGTKWSAGEVYSSYEEQGIVGGTITYDFDTAWSPPVPIVEALAEKFPSLNIAHYYCEGGMGYAGAAFYRDGKVADIEEYSAEDLPDEAWHKDAEGKVSWGDRDYDKIPMNEYESFCNEHFGGVVGG
jgi:hypothetical protein